MKFGFSSDGTLMGTNTKVNKAEILSQTAMLVSLEIGLPGQSLKDEAATVSVHQTFNAQYDAGYYQKKLYIPSDVSEIRRTASDARLYYREHTLPWRGKNRLLPSKTYMTFVSEMNTLKTFFFNARDNFKADYTNILTRSEQNLGSAMFNIGEYPDILELNDHFIFELDVSPVPAGAHMEDLKDLIGDDLEILKAEINANTEEDLKKATNDLWFRLFDVVRDLQKKMSNKEAKAYHKTIVTNIEDLLVILRTLNVAQDMELERMSEEVRQKLCSFDINDIKESEGLREDLASDAGKIMHDIIGHTGVDPDQARGRKSSNVIT